MGGRHIILWDVRTEKRIIELPIFSRSNADRFLIFFRSAEGYRPIWRLLDSGGISSKFHYGALQKFSNILGQFGDIYGWFYESLGDFRRILCQIVRIWRENGRIWREIVSHRISSHVHQPDSPGSLFGANFGHPVGRPVILLNLLLGSIYSSLV